MKQILLVISECPSVIWHGTGTVQNVSCGWRRIASNCSIILIIEKIKKSKLICTSLALYVIHSNESQMLLKIFSVEISVDAWETKDPSSLPVETSKWDLRYQTSPWRSVFPTKVSVFPWKAYAYFSSSADSLPQTRGYLLPAAGICPIPLHSWVPSWAFPAPAVEKHPLLGQEHPALLETPDRAGSRAGCECEERTMNSTILMAWPTGKALGALQQAPGGYTCTCIWITIEIHSLTIPWLPWSKYKVHSRWLISEKCNIGSVIMSYRQHTKCLCSTTESKFVK